ncbi:MAG: ECF transporter S component [Dysgonamonadaceae bacterium]|jgi:hypothetical protein|nr:ECF transporter S component [Dysgonamonadaceae bacterium]
MDTNVKTYSLNLANTKTYLFSLIFIVGNILLPQLTHFVPQGGLIWLPIYFFTLVAAYRYGIHVGVLTALLSPLANCLLFGMPPVAMLPIIMAKSVLLAIAASLASKYFGKVSFWGILSAILAYQIVGTGIEWAMVKDFAVAAQDFRIGIPGMLLQWVGGYFVLKALAKI